MVKSLDRTPLFCKVDSNGKPVYELPTYVSFGSPESGEKLRMLIEGTKNKPSLGYTYMGAYTKPNDFVGEVIGGNKGNEGQATLADRLNIFSIYKLFTSDSPHSSYKPTTYPKLQDVVGYKE